MDNVLSSSTGVRAVYVETDKYRDDLKVKNGQVVTFSDNLPIKDNKLVWECTSDGELVLHEWKLSPLYHKDFSKKPPTPVILEGFVDDGGWKLIAL